MIKFIALSVGTLFLVFMVGCKTISVESQLSDVHPDQDIIVILKTSDIFDDYLNKIKVQLSNVHFVDIISTTTMIGKNAKKAIALPGVTIIAVDNPALNALLKIPCKKNILAVNVLNLKSYTNIQLCGITVEIPLEQIITTFRYLVEDNTNILYFAPKKDRIKFKNINKVLINDEFSPKTIYVNNSKDIVDFVDELKPEEILVMLPEVSIFDSFSFSALLNKSFEKNVMFIGYNEYFVKLGCLFALAPDKEAEVMQVVTMIHSLNAGVSPKEIGIKSSIGTRMIFNIDTAKKIDFDYRVVVDYMDVVIGGESK